MYKLYLKKYFERCCCIGFLVLFYFDRNWSNYGQFFLDTNYLYFPYTFPSITFCSQQISTNALNKKRICNNTFDKCQWNGMSIECCDILHWVYTTNGSCLSFNSDQTLGHFKFTSYSRDKPASLTVILLSPVNISIQDSKDVNVTFREESSLSIRYGNFVTAFIKSIGVILVDKSTEYLNFHQRGCILPEEMDKSMRYYPFYSRSACLIECKFNKQMNRCNCSRYYLFNIYKGNFTNYKSYSGKEENTVHLCDSKEELKCINSIGDESNETNYDESANYNYIDDHAILDDECFCPPTCEQNEYRIVYHQKKRYSKTKLKIKVELMSTPKERIIMKPRFDAMHTFVGLASFSRIFTSISFFHIIDSFCKFLKVKHNVKNKITKLHDLSYDYNYYLL